jgi:hypothetical protein
LIASAISAKVMNVGLMVKPDGKTLINGWILYICSIYLKMAKNIAFIATPSVL